MTKRKRGVWSVFAPFENRLVDCLVRDSVSETRKLTLYPALSKTARDRMLSVVRVATIFLPQIEIAWRDPSAAITGKTASALCSLGLGCSSCDTGELNAGAGSKGSFKDVDFRAVIKYSAGRMRHELLIKHAAV